MITVLIAHQFIVISRILASQSRATGIKRQFVPITFENIDDNSFVHHFRFTRSQIEHMAELFNLPPLIKLRNRYTVDSRIALCALLKRLAYPTRLQDLEEWFQIAEGNISLTINYMLVHLDDNYSHLLKLRHCISERFINAWCQAISDAGAPLTTCFGFIDGTVIGVCRPGQNQSLHYNGHKRKHALKFQGVLMPDGIIHDLSGPYMGINHDTTLLARFNLFI